MHLNVLDRLKFGKIRLQEYSVYHILLLWSKDPQINLPLAPKNLVTALLVGISLLPVRLKTIVARTG
jgi:hypothetical protein